MIAASERQAFEKENDWQGWRPLTFAEKKVNFKSLQNEIDRLEASFDTEASAVLQAAREKYVKQLTTALNSKDPKEAQNVRLKAATEYSAVLKSHLRDAHDFGKNNAARELGKSAPATTKETRAAIELQAQAIANHHVADIEEASKIAAAEALAKGESAAVAAAAADLKAAERAKELVTHTRAIALAGYVNHGRNFVHGVYRGDIYGLQRSEILDSATCNYCLSIDGRIIEPDDPFGRNTVFHSSCRGIWVAILQDEEEKPPIKGIPQSLRDKYGDAVNDLVQPRKPQVRKNSPAAKEVERRDRQEE